MIVVLSHGNTYMAHKARQEKIRGASVRGLNYCTQCGCWWEYTQDALDDDEVSSCPECGYRCYSPTDTTHVNYWPPVSDPHTRDSTPTLVIAHGARWSAKLHMEEMPNTEAMCTCTECGCKFTYTTRDDCRASHFQKSLCQLTATWQRYSSIEVVCPDCYTPTSVWCEPWNSQYKRN